MDNITLGTYNPEEQTLCVIATFNRVNTNLSEKHFITYITNIANNFANILEKDIVLVNRQDSDRVVDIDEDEKFIKISSRLKRLKDDDISLMIFNKNIPENVGEYIKELENEIIRVEQQCVEEPSNLEDTNESCDNCSSLEEENNKLVSAFNDIRNIINDTI